MQRMSYAEFIGDFRNYHAAIRIFQISIEGCIAIANHLIAANNWQAPESYSDMFAILRAHGVIDDALANALMQMAQFRNRIVHIYRDIDLAQVHCIIQNNSDDIENFITKIRDVFS